MGAIGASIPIVFFGTLAAICLWSYTEQAHTAHKDPRGDLVKQYNTAVQRWREDEKRVYEAKYADGGNAIPTVVLGGIDFPLEAATSGPLAGGNLKDDQDDYLTYGDKAFALQAVNVDARAWFPEGQPIQNPKNISLVVGEGEEEFHLQAWKCEPITRKVSIRGGGKDNKLVDRTFATLSVLSGLNLVEKSAAKGAAGIEDPNEMLCAIDYYVKDDVKFKKESDAIKECAKWEEEGFLGEWSGDVTIVIRSPEDPFVQLPDIIPEDAVDTNTGVFLGQCAQDFGPTPDEIRAAAWFALIAGIIFILCGGCCAMDEMRGGEERSKFSMNPLASKS
mmetsp:Transcript_3766/g.4228  ORF Transcript_3766/g.4228 Transcript_3766/m.4228 type:complete len:334 (-) Transcript_3766:188-1189(-)|eukprot:CAMPEP_0197851106 /NCGR_PEP_ID=MMETSP1438-20131217/17268_1 /TAXON_ID=1461541 /ORGANISM="Pterosperma sp., Strain CCMP1384" /LENGTH=333 /DNA_ID=CAMNT_0043464587 /DNA_START=155 /DNA_END=1156 /DNA_ORIENTATION=+